MNLDELEQQARGLDMSGEARVTFGTTEDAPITAQPTAADMQAQTSADIQGIVVGLVTAFAPFFPSLKGVYSAATVQAIGDSVAAVAVKRGWDMRAAMGPEISALCVLVPVAIGTYGAVMGDIEAMRAKPAEEAREGGGGE